MVEFTLMESVIASIFAGTLFAIVYCLRILVLMERRVARVEIHIENIAARILSEEVKIEKEEKALAAKLNTRSKPKAKKKKKKR